MASSGRLPEEITDLLNDHIEVSAATKSLYGKGSASAVKRRVACMVQGTTSAGRANRQTDVTYSWDIYCDDVDIIESDVVKLPNGTEAQIVAIDNYSDENGPLYQVVHC
jgi:hypothetical protein